MLTLDQGFSTTGDSAPRGHLVTSGDMFGWHKPNLLREVRRRRRKPLLASRTNDAAKYSRMAGQSP